MKIKPAEGSTSKQGVRGFILRHGRSLLARCIPTVDNVRGPFYRKGAPFRTSLCPADEPGEPLIVSGRVVGLPDCRPLAGAILDVWQANAKGLYSNMLGLGDPDDPKTFLLRGRMRTDHEGWYRFETVLPGHYPLWLLTRPRHIHFIVTYPGYVPLITQLFFEGDKYLERDPWVKDSLIIRLTKGGAGADQKTRLGGLFDIVLEEEGKGIADDLRDDGRRGKRISLWIKILYTLFVCLLTPVYWVEYGPANFLWFSDIALLVTVTALWLENRLLASMMTVAALLLEVV